MRLSLPSRYPDLASPNSDYPPASDPRMGGHRHDGHSPLPLGMDVSPAPTRWTGASTIWPHDPPSGWSYCVMIPSWIELPEPKATEHDHAASSKTTVFFRVLVGIQSPEGVSTLHGILRRFSDFLKLNDALKRAFPNKKLPAPPKKSLRQISHNKHQLQQRRLALSDWIAKLLGDIDLSRSLLIATFLELDDAARAAMPDTDRQELQTWLKKGIDKEIYTLPSENDLSETEDNDATMESVVAQEEATSPGGGSMEKHSSLHVRKNSIDSDASELSFTSGSELSFPPLIGDNRDQISEGYPSYDGEILKSVQALMRIDQKGYVRRVILNLQRRAIIARADMEDLVARLNQETTGKEFFQSKAKDLEVELSKLKQKSIESLQHAVAIEREGYMNLQWELEETKVALARAQKEAQLAHEGKIQFEQQLEVARVENMELKHMLSETRSTLQSVEGERDNIKAKAMAETRVLVKEIKALRKQQPELKRNLEEALKANKELEVQLQTHHKMKEIRMSILHEVGALRERLQQCTVDFLAKEDAREGNNAALADAADLLMTSDSRIGLLIAEAQLLAEEGGADADEVSERKVDAESDHRSDETNVKLQVSHEGNDTTRKLLTDIFIDNAHLHKLVNSLTLKTLISNSKGEKAETTDVAPRKSMLYRFL